MADINTSEKSSKIKSFSRPVNRQSTRVDLTPMVDLGFLLITFFVFTSALSTPKVMDLYETQDGPPAPVKSSAAMTILVGKDHRLFYYNGILDEKAPEQQIVKTDYKAIRDIISHKRKTTDRKYLMYIIKADKHSTFGDQINILDEMLLCGIKPGHYAESELSKAEEAFMSSGYGP